MCVGRYVCKGGVGYEKTKTNVGNILEGKINDCVVHSASLSDNLKLPPSDKKPGGIEKRGSPSRDGQSVVIQRYVRIPCPKVTGAVYARKRDVIGRSCHHPVTISYSNSKSLPCGYFRFLNLSILQP